MNFDDPKLLGEISQYFMYSAFAIIALAILIKLWSTNKIPRLGDLKLNLNKPTYNSPLTPDIELERKATRYAIVGTALAFVFAGILIFGAIWYIRCAPHIPKGTMIWDYNSVCERNFSIAQSQKIFSKGLFGVKIQQQVPVETRSKLSQLLKDPQDEEFRTQISSSYCNVLRAKGDVRIENYNECVIKYKTDPLGIYKVIVDETISKSWDQLATNEKTLVVEEVKKRETILVESYEFQKIMKEMLE